MTYQMNLDAGPFQLIRTKQKDVEMRLFDERRQKIEVGDIIEFTNKKTLEMMSVEVLNLRRFTTFVELYQYYDKQRLGYKFDEIADPKDMEQYYSKELINKYGVLAIEIMLKDASAR